MEIECGVDGSTLTFVISDSGVAFDPTQQAEADVTLGVEDVLLADWAFSWYVRS